MFWVAPDRTIKSSKLLACSRCRRIGIQLFRQEQRFSKPELKLAFYEFCYDVIRIILLEMPVGAVADKSGMIIMEAACSWENTSFLYVTARQAGYAALRRCKAN